MSFIAFRKDGKEVLINTARIISVEINPENKKTRITCTDQFIIEIDDTNDEVRKKLGIRKAGEKTIGFGYV